MYNVFTVFMSRMIFISILALASSLPLNAMAQTYPSKPIQVVVPYPPGGIMDNVTRKLGTELSAILGQPVVVENKGGAGGSIGAAQVARSKADGYTLLTVFDTHAVNPLLYKLSFDSDRDLKPITLIATSPLVLVVHPSVPARNLREFVELAKAKPDSLHYASTGAGSSNHLTMELFKETSGTTLNHVPYKGGVQAITDVIGGQVQTMFVSATSVLAHIRSGKMRALAVTTRERIPALPDIPTVSETYHEFEVNSWIGLLAPAGIPAEVLAKLNGGVNAALKSPEFQKFLNEQSLKPAGDTSEKFGAFMKAETQKWGAIIKRKNIRVE